MRYVINRTRYADTPMQIGELPLGKIPEELMPLIREAASRYSGERIILTESRAYRLKMPDGRGIVINVQAMQGNNQLRRHPCT